MGRDEHTFGTPIDQSLQQDFDFEKNLALFNKEVNPLLYCTNQAYYYSFALVYYIYIWFIYIYNYFYMYDYTIYIFVHIHIFSRLCGKKLIP